MTLETSLTTLIVNSEFSSSALLSP